MPYTVKHNNKITYLITGQQVPGLILDTRLYMHCLKCITKGQIAMHAILLNQARAGHRPARAWFLKIDPVRIVGMRACVCVCVCPSPRLSISSGVI